jgi:xanthine dehydrogenase accessory factor
MITSAQSRRVEELAAAREPFVTATVVRVQHPTSVEAGSVALVLGDGTIEGFVGGVCAEHSVRAYSMVALRTEEPVLLRIVPDPDREAAPEGAEVSREDGVVTVANPCLSGGTIEVFLEPAPPPPRVVVVGETPIAGALKRIGGELGLEMVAAGDDARPAAGDLALVVAAHGRDELDALRRALEADVPYVGLVASEKRGAGVLAELRDAGVAEERLERIEVPAGIPIGSHAPAEVAVSILARIVSVRRGARAGAPGAAAEETAGLAVDPICGMTVAAVDSTLSVERDGETVYFCSEGCKAKFEAREHASVTR